MHPSTVSWSESDSHRAGRAQSTDASPPSGDSPKKIAKANFFRSFVRCQCANLRVRRSPRASEGRSSVSAMAQGHHTIATVPHTRPQDSKNIHAQILAHSLLHGHGRRLNHTQGMRKLKQPFFRGEQCDRRALGQKYMPVIGTVSKCDPRGLVPGASYHHTLPCSVLHMALTLVLRFDEDETCQGLWREHAVGVWIPGQLEN
jgi:hypothetical protein